MNFPLLLPKYTNSKLINKFKFFHTKKINVVIIDDTNNSLLESIQRKLDIQSYVFYKCSSNDLNWHSTTCFAFMNGCKASNQDNLFIFTKNYNSTIFCNAFNENENTFNELLGRITKTIEFDPYKTMDASFHSNISTIKFNTSIKRLVQYKAPLNASFKVLASCVYNEEIFPLVIKLLTGNEGAYVISFIDLLEDNLLINLSKMFNIKLCKNESTLTGPYDVYLFGNKKLRKFLAEEINNLKDFNFICIEEINLEKRDEVCEKFNKISRNYYETLTAKKLGSILAISQLCDSTMNYFSNELIQRIGSIVNIAYLSFEQNSAIGRTNNQWISPSGSLCLTFNLSIGKGNYFYNKLSIIQHICAVSVVKTFIGLMNSAKMGLFKIKWPNDIYYNNDTKIGGILVRSFMNSKNQSFELVVGIGLNILNEKPTISLKKIFEMNNIDFKNDQMTLEIITANILNKIENYLDMVNFNRQNINNFIDDYHSIWLHSNQQIEYHDGKTIRKGIIKAINHEGFIILESNHNENIIIGPNDNSFDMMNGMIRYKIT